MKSINFSIGLILFLTCAAHGRDLPFEITRNETRINIQPDLTYTLTEDGVITTTTKDPCKKKGLIRISQPSSHVAMCYAKDYKSAYIIAHEKTKEIPFDLINKTGFKLQYPYIIADGIYRDGQKYIQVYNIDTKLSDFFPKSIHDPVMSSVFYDDVARTFYFSNENEIYKKNNHEPASKISELDNFLIFRHSVKKIIYNQNLNVIAIISDYGTRGPRKVMLNLIDVSKGAVFTFELYKSTSGAIYSVVPDGNGFTYHCIDINTGDFIYGDVRWELP
ncbi:hypothetical protein VST7929_01040 [Vibrio stylophorae]|uniref:Uncharacterized protein n=1 Tax=Vibrio stylophorae TaxID=659351 RepID=A0ABN8DS65_9VIBR|nr:hypothetical protein [Vibrio stylophorae]CAH0533178.1 hypothetical protein VST7929_01040 [Vibrio stylophorae]